MQSHLFVIVSCALFLLLHGCASPQKSICDQVEFSQESKIHFSDNEKILLCGDPKKESWTHIPPAQAEYTLRNMLRQRGYFNPEFKYVNGVLSVAPGPLHRVSSLKYDGEPEGFHDVHIRDIIGAALTSETLDKVQNFTLTRLKNLGYACPDVKLIADEKTGAVAVHIDPGKKYDFGDPVTPDAADLDLTDQAMRRYDAFKPGAQFRQEWLKLTSNRAETDGIVISSEFINHCPSPGTALELNQRILGADKRLVTIGVGASTEEIPIAQLTFKSVRLDQNGSNINVNLYGSHRRQALKLIYNDFVLRNVPRFDIAPKLTLEHDNEPTFNTSDIELSLPFEYRGDTNSYAWLVAAGPSATRSFAHDAYAANTGTFFSLFGRATLSSHDFELYQTDPRSGWWLDFDTEIVSEGIALNPIANGYQLQGNHLFKINPVDPPQWILGVRWGAATIDTEDRPPRPGRLPARYFLSLGGDQNLRGFGRRELNLGTVGGLTSVFAGTEVRYAKSLSLGVGIEPFAFFDIGSLGSQPFHLDPIYFYNPGLGVRVMTPVGAVRGTVAHGYLSRDADLYPDLSHLQIFFSFGREF